MTRKKVAPKIPKSRDALAALQRKGGPHGDKRDRRGRREREVPGLDELLAGVDPEKHGGEAMAWEPVGEEDLALKGLIAALEREGIPYALIGGMAVHAWGGRRPTYDADILAGAERERILAFAARNGYGILRDTEDMIFLKDPDTGMKADILLSCKVPFYESLLERARPVPRGGPRTAALEDLVLLKALAWRKKDIDDIGELLHDTGRQLEEEYLKKWAGILEEDTGIPVGHRIDTFRPDAPVPRPAEVPFLDAVSWTGTGAPKEEYLSLLGYEAGWQYIGCLGEPSKEEWAWVRYLAEKYGSWLSAEFATSSPGAVLEALGCMDVQLFEESQGLLEGGALAALECGNFRAIRDIDFLYGSAFSDSIRMMRNAGPAPLFKDTRGLEFPMRRMELRKKGLRDSELPLRVSFTEHGRMIRFAVRIRGETLGFKFLKWMLPDDFDPGRAVPGIPVPCLSLEDMFAVKLVANANRWNTPRALLRDVIDMAALAGRHGGIPERAFRKAEAWGYIDAAEALGKALEALEDTEWQRECFDSLKVTESGKSLLVEGLKILEEALRKNWSSKRC